MQYNYLQAIYLSFYSRSLYRDVVNNWRNKTFLYLLLMLAICLIVKLIITQHPLLHNPVMIIKFLLFFYVLRILDSLVFAALGKVIALFLQIKLTYLTIFRLTMVAITPSIVINNIVDLFYANTPNRYLFYSMGAMIYLAFAMLANKSDITSAGTSDFNVPKSSEFLKK